MKKDSRQNTKISDFYSKENRKIKFRKKIESEAENRISRFSSCDPSKPCEIDSVPCPINQSKNDKSTAKVDICLDDDDDSFEQAYQIFNMFEANVEHKVKEKKVKDLIEELSPMKEKKKVKSLEREI